MTPRQPSDDLEMLFRGRASHFAALLQRLVLARADGRGARAVLDDLADLFAATGALADVMGRARVLAAAKALGAPVEPHELPPPVRAGGGIGSAPTDLLPDVPALDAIQDIITRHPEVAHSVAEVRDVYARHGFALALSADETITAHVQDAIARGMANGKTRAAVIADIQAASPDFSTAYADTVYRNNVNTAYTTGQFDQLKDPDVKRVIGALRFTAIGGRAGDGRTTMICRAFDGTIAPPEHAVWNLRSTPAHHGCRSGLDMLSWEDLKRMGLLDKSGGVIVRIPNPGVAAAPGFGRRGAA